MIRTWPQHARKLTFNVAAFCALYTVGAFILVYVAAEGGI